MKGSFILCFSLLFYLSALTLKAQNKGTLNYIYTVDDGMTRSKRIQNLIVYFNGNQSIEFPFNKPQTEQSEGQTANSAVKSLSFKADRGAFLYKDFDMGKLLLSDFVHFRKTYLIQDTLSNFNWKITQEQQQIGGYNCLKATTTFRGTKYEAWFTKDVNIKNGPWKFCGLPGLIVKIADENQIYTYLLASVGLDSKFETSLVSIPKSYEYDEAITHLAFMQLYNDDLAKVKQHNKDSAFSDEYGSGFTRISVPPRKEKF